MTPDSLDQAVERYRTARVAMRRPMRDSATAMAQELAEQRNDLVKRMETRWGWLDRNAGHPQFVEREDALIQDIHEYERTEDALNRAASVLYGDAA